MKTLTIHLLTSRGLVLSSAAVWWEVANPYMKNGSNPIMTLLDCSKAFNMVKYSILFNKLLDKGLPAVVVRTIIVVYEKQYAWVRWGKARSEMFPIENGTRQGSVFSPALFSIYMDEILVNLRNLGVGCYVGEVFIGAMGYANDLLLLDTSPTASLCHCVSIGGSCPGCVLLLTFV